MTKKKIPSKSTEIQGLTYMNDTERNFRIIVDLPEKLEAYAKMRVRGCSLKEIADEFQVSERTIRDYSRAYSRKAYELRYQDLLSEIESRCSNPNATMLEIASSLGITLKGLKNVLYDLGKGRSPAKEIIEGYLRHGKNLEWVAEFYGISYLTLKRLMESMGLEKQTVIAEKRNAKSAFPRLTKINLESVQEMSAFELNPQYQEDTDVLMTDPKALKSFKRDERDLIRTQRRLFGRYDDLTSVESCKKWYDAKYEIYRRMQYGIATKENFYFNTMAKFRETTRPSRSPDYIVDKKNAEKVLYWFTRNGVIRGTRRWGIRFTANCEWMIRLESGIDYWGTWDPENMLQKMIFGKARWEDFIYKTTISQFEPEHLCGFSNMTFGEINQFQGINFLSPQAFNEEFFYQLKLDF